MEEFKNWQQECKNISYKVSMDNASRVKRVLSILCIDNITQCSLSDLEANDSFKALSVSVKSQMRRAVRLYIEYVDAHSPQKHIKKYICLPVWGDIFIAKNDMFGLRRIKHIHRKKMTI